MEDTKADSLIPYKLESDGGELTCHWLHTHNIPFTDPFFDETILRCRFFNNQVTPAITGSLAAMEEAARQLADTQPAAIIFHISRCGSTLVSQMLSTLNRFVVLAEVPFFDQLLRLPADRTEYDEQSAGLLLAAAIKHYGAKRSESEKHLVIKADCWHIFFHRQLRQLFPDVPFILMYRNPAEVLRSLLKQPGIQTVRSLVDPQIFGFVPGKPDFYARDLNAAAILEKMLAKNIEVSKTDKLSVLVNYNEAPITIIKKIAAFTGFDITEDEFSAMENRSFYHSKYPGQTFSEAPITEIPPCIAPAIELYYQLDALKNLIPALI